MRNIVEVLKQKQSDLEQLQTEIEILRRAVSLLSEEAEDPRSETATLGKTGTDSRIKGAVADISSPRQFP
ncbi:MAG TPA: hypothetical protein VF786_15105 [Terriglobales bacterium]